MRPTLPPRAVPEAATQLGADAPIITIPASSRWPSPTLRAWGQSTSQMRWHPPGHDLASHASWRNGRALPPPRVCPACAYASSSKPVLLAISCCTAARLERGHAAISWSNHGTPSPRSSLVRSCAPAPRRVSLVRPPSPEACRHSSLLSLACWPACSRPLLVLLQHGTWLESDGPQVARTPPSSLLPPRSSLLCANGSRFR